jgi:hypothetical protein
VNEEIAMTWARLSARTGDPAEEVRRWNVVLERFPKMQRGYKESAWRLRALGHGAEADTVLQRAMETFPMESWPSIAYAAAAHDRKDWLGAVARWEAVRAAWPNIQDGYQRGAAALDALKRHEEAARIRAQWLERVGT